MSCDDRLYLPLLGVPTVTILEYECRQLLPLSPGQLISCQNTSLASNQSHNGYVVDSNCTAKEQLTTCATERNTIRLNIKQATEYAITDV